MPTDSRARLLAAVDDWREAMLDLLARLVRTPSVTGSDAEHQAQAELADLLQAEGLEVDHWRIDLDALRREPDFPGAEAPRGEAWGLVARLPGSGGGRSLMLNGHVDVVPPGHGWHGEPFAGQVRGGQLHGRGACDMKAGLVATIWAVHALRHSGLLLAGNVLFASVVSEEDGGLGTFATLRRGWRADACVIPEPTSLDLVPATAGALTFRLVVAGRAAHASRRTEGVSALDKFAPVLAALARLEEQRNAEVDPLSARWRPAYALSIGTVHAGEWASTVPDRLVAEGRLGVALDEPVAAARAQLEQAVADVCAADAWLRDHPVAVQWSGGQLAPGRLPAGSDLLERLRVAHAAAGGGAQQVWAAPYGSDLRLLAQAGVPTLHYGPGDARLAHAPDESVPLPEFAMTARTLALLALDLCGPPR